MKKIKELKIKAIYTVILCDVEVSDEVYEALGECYDKGGDVPMPDECTINGEEELASASEWLTDNINESDAIDWEFEIEDFEEE